MHTGFRLSVLASMNDPRESKDWILHTVRSKSGATVDRKALDEAVAGYKRKVRIGAFCRDQPSTSDNEPSVRGYGRPRMWAQYADNHRGVCIVLDRGRLDQAIRRKYPDHGDSWVRDGEVEYVTSYNDPASIAIEYREGGVQACVTEYFTRYGGSLFFTKHVDWRDENEFRWVYFDADESGTGSTGNELSYVDIRGSVVGLVLGGDYENSHLPIARMFAEYFRLNGNIVRCQWNRLVLYLTTFADEDGHLVPVGKIPEVFDFQVGPPQIKPFAPPTSE